MEQEIKIKVDFHIGAKVEIVGIPDKEYPEDETYEVLFLDNKTNKLLHSDTLKPNYWTKTGINYYVEWKVVVMKNGLGIIHEEVLDLKGKDVLVAITNTPIGDNLAWVEYVREFGKIHNCNITFQTFIPSIFEKSYDDLTIVGGDTYEFNDSKFYASYKISYGIPSEEHDNLRKLLFKKKYLHFDDLTYWKKNESPYHPSLIPLQHFAPSVLGLELKEMRPHLICENDERPIQKKYVCISEFASGEIKQWNNKVGWQTLVNELTSLGYEVVSISKEKTDLKKVTKRNGNFPLTDRMWYLHHCEFFIGVSSGLAWLAWACGKKVVMISGVTKATNEFTEDCIRVINEDVCHGCWNSEQHADKFTVFEKTLCPENKNWECSRKISPKMVIDKIKENNLI
jgi:autotransporter strand-loop-strand O-heptosyltransferase